MEITFKTPLNNTQCLCLAHLFAFIDFNEVVSVTKITVIDDETVSLTYNDGTNISNETILIADNYHVISQDEFENGKLVKKNIFEY